MTESLKAPRGTRDLFDDEIARFIDIESAARSLFIHYGYTEIRTPIFEPSALFERSVGEETDIVSKEMYVFRDRKDRSLALRPEGTASVVRAFIENNLSARGTVKLFYAGPMFRYERPQGGRYRQFHQLGCELLGAASLSADIEMIDLTTRLLERLSVPAKLRINHLGCPACKPQYARVLVEFLQNRVENLCQDCRVRMEKNPLRVLDCKVATCREIMTAAPSIPLCHACATSFDDRQAALAENAIAFDVDRRLVRGLDYYTGLVFEMISDKLGAQDAVLGGGRYDTLVAALGGPATPAIGFATGMDRLSKVMELTRVERAVSAPLVYVIGLGDAGRRAAVRFTRLMRRVQERSTLAQSARPEWIEQDLQERSLKAALRAADKAHAAYAAIMGDDEAAAGVVTLREMAGGNQVKMPMESATEDAIERHFEAARMELNAMRLQGERKS